MMWRVATHAGVVQWLVHQTSTLRMRVRSPSLAPNADMVELADTMDLGSIAKACRFKSCYPHHKSLYIIRAGYVSFLEFSDI